MPNAENQPYKLVMPPIPDILLPAIPGESTEDYEERVIEAMTPRMEVIRSIGRAAYISKMAEVGDTGSCGFAKICIKISDEYKCYLRWLLEEIDERYIWFNQWTLRCEISPMAFLEDEDVKVQSLAVQAAGCRAMAAALLSVGVSCRVETEVD